LIFTASAALLASTPTTEPTRDHSAHESALAESITQFDRILSHDPKNAEAWQARGSAHFRLGHVEQAIADFDRFLELEPDAKPQHWQRGIALYEAGRFADAAAQFNLHKTVNPDDVENTAWHFLCVARTDGVEKARASLIPTRGDPRVPLMEVYDLFGGRAKPQDVLAATEAGHPDAEELVERRFYAHLYLGLYFEALGQAAEAQEHVRLAAETYTNDGYMGDSARVHLARMHGPATRPSR
jgi:lipoprotein NlpI